MGALFLNEIPYSGFSNDDNIIIPNPSGTATTQLTSININGTVYSIPSGPPVSDYYLLDPDLLDLVGAGDLCTSQTGKGFPCGFIFKGSQAGSVGTVSLTTYNSIYVMRMPYYGTKAFSFIQQIDKDCKTVEIVCDIVNYASYQWNNSRVMFSYDAKIANDGGFTNTLQDTYLTHYSMTSAEIMAQPNVTITSTDPKNLAHQTVIFDLEPLNLTDDVSLGLFSCDCDFYIRSIEAKY